MNYGFVLPGGSATQQLELARVAEDCGWDGIFVWESNYGVDPWTLLAAMAQRTTRIKLGTMLTPVPWRRPWKLASQVVTLDQLSNGRAILSVGLGAKLGETGETMDRRVRARRMDESIDLMRGLWEGRHVYEGEEYRLDLSERDDLFDVARPVQHRIPIWVVAVWPAMRSMRRVLRCDGIIPAVMVEGEASGAPTPEQTRDILTWLRENGARKDIDLITEGETPADDLPAARDKIAPLIEAGATWWNETRWETPYHSPERLEQVHRRLKAGPPRS